MSQFECAKTADTVKAQWISLVSFLNAFSVAGWVVTDAENLPETQFNTS